MHDPKMLADMFDLRPGQVELRLFSPRAQELIIDIAMMRPADRMARDFARYIQENRSDIARGSMSCVACCHVIDRGSAPRVTQCFAWCHGTDWLRHAVICDRCVDATPEPELHRIAVASLVGWLRVAEAICRGGDSVLHTRAGHA